MTSTSARIYTLLLFLPYLVTVRAAAHFDFTDGYGLNSRSHSNESSLKVYVRDYPPYAVLNANKLSGIDIILMQTVASKIDISIQYLILNDSTRHVDR